MQEGAKKCKVNRGATLEEGLSAILIASSVTPKRTYSTLRHAIKPPAVAVPGPLSIRNKICFIQKPSQPRHPPCPVFRSDAFLSLTIRDGSNDQGDGLTLSPGIHW